MNYTTPRIDVCGLIRIKDAGFEIDARYVAGPDPILLPEKMIFFSGHLSTLVTYMRT